MSASFSSCLFNSYYTTRLLRGLFCCTCYSNPPDGERCGFCPVLDLLLWGAGRQAKAMRADKTRGKDGGRRCTFLCHEKGAERMMKGGVHNCTPSFQNHPMGLYAPAARARRLRQRIFRRRRCLRKMDLAPPFLCSRVRVSAQK